MDGIVYHASKKAGLHELDPDKSQHERNHGKKFIYATTSKELAMFLSMRIADLYSVVDGQGTVEDPAVLVERLPGIFNKYLHNPTYIYSISAQDFERGTSYEGEVVADKKQQVLSEEHIEDVYHKLEELEKTGTVQLYRYPNRPKNIPLDNSDLIEHMMLPTYRETHNLKIVKTILQTYPKLFPKVMRSLFVEEMNNVKKKIGDKLKVINKKNLLPSGEEKAYDTDKAKLFRESLAEGAPTLEEQAENSRKFQENALSLDTLNDKSQARAENREMEVV